MTAHARIDAARRRYASALAVAAAAWPLAPCAALSRVQPWPAGKPAPALGLDDLDGRPRTLRDWRGQAVLVNFWASWCEPCLAEMNELSRLAARHAGRLAVVGVNYKESAETARRRIAGLPFVFTTLLDLRGSAFKLWTQGVLPTSVLVDRDGRPRLSVAGEMDWSSAEAAGFVEPLLARCDTGTTCAPGAPTPSKEKS